MTFTNLFTAQSGYTSLQECYSNPYFLIDLILTSVFVITFSILLAWRLRNKVIAAIYLSIDALFIIAAALNLHYLALFLMLLEIGSTIIFLFVNAGVIRKYITLPLKKHSNSMAEKGVDKEKLIENICSAVDWLSKTKTGALITFERSTPLDDFMKSGTIINCPVTPEIIETIFYEGTRLHDGACIIRGGVIVAAAVYYTPSTKAVVGKFGARHRAALGISEVSDSITIVVSEETGRIAITHGGIMDNVKSDEFEKILRDQIIGE